jgi:hypothetical protein
VTGSGDPASTNSPRDLPAVSASAPPLADEQAAPCAKVLAQLPVTLNRLAPRVVHTLPETPYVVAWGDPAVVLQCGADRPKDLKAGSGAQFILGGAGIGPYYDVQRDGNANVYTSVDRAAYVSITIPAKYQGADILPPLSTAIAKALPAVCSVDPTTPNVRDLCTRRS